MNNFFHFKKTKLLFLIVLILFLNNNVVYSNPESANTLNNVVNNIDYNQEAPQINNNNNNNNIDNKRNSIEYIINHYKNKYEGLLNKVLDKNGVVFDNNGNNLNFYKNNHINLWVYFKNKDIENKNPSDLLNYINDKSKQRRSLRGYNLNNNLNSNKQDQNQQKEKSLYNELDYPINENYVNNILNSIGNSTLATIKHRFSSNWLNAASFNIRINEEKVLEHASDCPQKLKETLTNILKLDYVDRIEIVNNFNQPNKRVIDSIQAEDASELIDYGENTIVNGVDYGKSFYQLNQIKIVDAHKLGYKGKGVTIMIADTGFMKSHEALKNIKIKKERDFIENDDNTEGSDLAQESHGTFVLSQIGSNIPGKIMGAAPEAEFLLAKTEIVATETSVEEDYLIKAIEWGESEGADVVSISLSYSSYYEYWERDGSSPLSKAIDIASTKGIVVVIASGNDGEKGIGPPGDSNLAVTVGAVDNFGDVAIFSSAGPTSDGRLKPEVVARGVLCYGASDQSVDTYKYQSGTSHSAPLVAGSVALLLEAHPTWNPKQIKEALIKTSSQFKAPDNYKGFGIINIVDAINSNPSGSSLKNNDKSKDSQSCDENCDGICISNQCLCSHKSQFSSNICSKKIRCGYMCRYNNGKCSEYDCFRCVDPNESEKSNGRTKCDNNDQETQVLGNSSPILKFNSLILILILIKLLL
ncbi:hypothetical protein DICPUDRAFT_152099 [Dictyostelium purpureum]|uniref:Peptidase S8/S53 domain-containing protein n=1 Tax=Dictyostelium purpureum TaxID=5786 RepID=F0ZKH3_DICPU|nr:uncharacterized protein DICPUDRAFT_152099 [Dictyostelium purpureum]EGC35554.1 hypothetical protein DICPUDRAFT_152099 [Dictyostelium purpureum]|eukprot:XP_003287925.1 hypothetical protein DICPUDRAFT_152099 [Dictyostelium purpureum]